MDGQAGDPNMEESASSGDCEQALRTLYYFLDGELTRSAGWRSSTTWTNVRHASRRSTSRPSSRSSLPGVAGTRFPRACADG